MSKITIIIFICYDFSFLLLRHFTIDSGVACSELIKFILRICGGPLSIVILKMAVIKNMDVIKYVILKEII